MRMISIGSGLLESFLRQCADFSAGIMIAFYLRYINEDIRPVSSTTVGLIGAGFFLASLTLAPIMGAMSDAKGRKPFIILGAAIGAIVVQIYPFTFSLWLIFVALTLEGIGNASEAPSMLGFLSDSTVSSASLRGRVMAMYQIVTVASTAAGYLLGGFLWDSLGLDGFRLLSLVYLAGIGIVFWGVDEPKTARYQDRHGWRKHLQLLKIPSTRQLLVIALIINSILGIWLSQSAFQMSGASTNSDQALMGGFSGRQIGSAFAYFAIVFSAGAYFWGMMSAKLNKRSILISAQGGICIVLLALYLINHSGGSLDVPFILPFDLSILLLAVGIFMASGFTPVLLGNLADTAEGHFGLGGTVMGLYFVTLGLGRIIGGALGGFSADLMGVDGMILLSAIFVSAALTITFLTRKPGRPFSTQNKSG